MTSEDIEFFNLLASTWDDEEVKSTPEKVSLVLDAAVVREGESVLDLGTGTGVLLRPLLERIGPEGRIVAVDASTAMISRARQKTQGETRVEFRLTDFEKNTVGGRFDLIMLYCVYPHLERPVETLRRLRDNNLRPGGRIVIAFPCSEDFINEMHRQRAQEGLTDSDLLPSAVRLAEMLTAEGLCAKASDTSGRDYYMVTLERF